MVGRLGAFPAIFRGFGRGTPRERPSGVADLYRIEDLVAWQLAIEIKDAVFELAGALAGGA